MLVDSSSIFYSSKKWIKETVLSLSVKNEIKCARKFQLLTFDVSNVDI